MRDEPSSVPAFVAELFRAANEVERLTSVELKRLMARAARTIRDMREELDAEVADANQVADPLLDELDQLAHSPEQPVGAIMAAALLRAAETIRALHIVLSSKGEVITGSVTDE